ncbi:MAG TPA: hypothetical protein VGC34_02360 [Steroidobacteraceae bacterium]
MVDHLEQRLVKRRADPVHLDATMWLRNPDIRQQEIRPRPRRVRSA